MDIPMRVTILGLGRAARATAGYLMEKGCAVTLWGRSGAEVEKLARDGIQITGACAGHYAPNVEKELKKAVQGAKWILVQTVAAGHAPIAHQLCGLLEEGQRILVFNGNWGAYEFWKELGEEAEQKKVEIAETGSQIFLADYVGEACHIKSIKKEIALAAVHADCGKMMCEELQELFPQFIPDQNVVSTSLNSSNPVMHAPIALFNITRMENGEDYSFYATAATRLTLAAVEKVDAERCAVARAVGVSPMRCVDIINSFWPNKYETLYDAVKNNDAYLSGKGPVTIQHRYIEEDIPFGIAPVALLGKLYGVETPNIDAMLSAYRWLLDVDFLKLAPKFDVDAVKKLVCL